MTLKKKYIEDGVAIKKAIEDARYVFFNVCESRVIFTMNVRRIYNF